MLYLLARLKEHRLPLLTLLLSIAATVGALYLADRSYELDSFEIEISARPSSAGVTSLDLPPLGQVNAETHRSPIHLTFTLRHIDITSVNGLLVDDAERDKNLQSLLDDLADAGRDFAIRLIVVATLLGLLAGAIVLPLGWRRVLLGGATALVLSTAVVATTQATLRPEAFSEPRFTGTLKAAPAVIGAFRENFDTLEDFRDEIRRLARNLSELYATVEGFSAVDAGDGLRILHVSDIHDNVAAYDLVESVAKGFSVDFIVDSGDITDLGTGPEADLVTRLGSIETPYLWVAGNHDSPTVVSRMKAIENVTALDGLHKVAGVEVMGFPDPQAMAPTGIIPDSEANQRVAKDIEQALLSLESSPDVLVVHSPESAERAAGKVPLILTGHTHRASIKSKNGSRILNPGTAGGAGLRTLKRRGGVPMTLNLLYLSRVERKLVAVDQITVRGPQREFSLERVFVGDDTLSAAPPSGRSAAAIDQILDASAPVAE